MPSEFDIYSKDPKDLSSKTKFPNLQNSVSEVPLVGDRVPKKSQAGSFGGQAALKYPKDSQAGIPTDPSRQVHLMYVEPPKSHFKHC